MNTNETLKPKPALKDLTPRERRQPRFVEEGTMMRKIHAPLATVSAGLEPIVRQIAREEVAHAVHKYRFLEENPLQRLANTFNSGIFMIHGDHEESLRVSDRINDIHKHVRGKVEGQRYTAEDPELLKWVGATLGYASIQGFEFFVGPLAKEEKDQYVRELGPFYNDLHLPIETFPQSYDELQSYIEEATGSGKIEVGDIARTLLPYALLKNNLLTEMLMSYEKMVMLYFLPDKIRRQFNTEDPETGEKIVRLQRLNSWQRGFVEISGKLLRTMRPVLPTLRDYYLMRREFIELGMIEK